MKPSDYFIAGTDTGVGKTLVTALLAIKLRSLGIDAGVMKPFASGCELRGGELVSEDAEFLRAATGISDELDLINPIRLEEPLAPLMAARRAGISTENWKPKIRKAYAELKRRHECVLVEGVGGLLVPVGEAEGQIWGCLDLIHELSLPVIVVARRTLGTINHTCLTAATRLKPPTRYAGLVFCDAAPVEPENVAANESPAFIQELTRLPILGIIPFQNDLEAATLKEAASKLRMPD